MTIYKIRQINGSAVKRFRKQLDLSVADLAARANLSKEAIYKIENGSTKTPTTYTIEQIANALLVQTDDILETFSFEERSTVALEPSIYTEFLAQQKKKLCLNIEKFKQSKKLIIENSTLEFLTGKNGMRAIGVKGTNHCCISCLCRYSNEARAGSFSLTGEPVWCTIAVLDKIVQLRW